MKQSEVPLIYTHPRMEKKLGVDEEHCIVDRVVVEAINLRHKRSVDIGDMVRKIEREMRDKKE